MYRNGRRTRERFIEIPISEIFVFIEQPFCPPDWLIGTTGRPERGKEAVGRSALSRIQTLASISFAKNPASLTRLFIRIVS